MNKVFDSLWEQDIKKQKSDRVFLLVLSVILAFMVVFTIFNQYVFLNVSVSGPSMQPTLQTGDVVIINRQKEVSVGDIVVIGDVKNYWLIKRVIACEEGDAVEIKDGLLKVNGKIIEEDYVLDGFSAGQDEHGKWVLSAGEIFYLGDNRLNSSDSRTYGACKDENIVGVVEEWSLKHRKLRSQFIKSIDRIKSFFN